MQSEIHQHTKVYHKLHAAGESAMYLDIHRKPPPVFSKFTIPTKTTVVLAGKLSVFWCLTGG